MPKYKVSSKVFTTSVDLPIGSIPIKVTKRIIHDLATNKFIEEYEIEYLESV